ncbi:MAG: hypothetical protein EAZ99_08275 [Alphaproteobacteria bacterium]|nr:hypothetical protein [Alphaproteobacteria bacterium]TAD89977.1 MAG: hypothetical protein EAZ99_08275 [Alphaproteobacteria bacterium]
MSWRCLVLLAAAAALVPRWLPPPPTPLLATLPAADLLEPLGFRAERGPSLTVGGLYEARLWRRGAAWVVALPLSDSAEGATLLASLATDRAAEVAFLFSGRLSPDYPRVALIRQGIAARLGLAEPPQAPVALLCAGRCPDPAAPPSSGRL